MKTHNELTEHGLTGNSGFAVAGLPTCFHVNANHAANDGTVFVEHKDHWRRMKAEEATAKKKRIIPCTYCAKPAISLDHSWPYLVENTYCADHKETAAAACRGEDLPNALMSNIGALPDARKTETR
jgi:hypothetical protein